MRSDELKTAVNSSSRIPHSSLSYLAAAAAPVLRDAGSRLVLAQLAAGEPPGRLGVVEREALGEGDLDRVILRPRVVEVDLVAARRHGEARREPLLEEGGLEEASLARARRVAGHADVEGVDERLDGVVHVPDDEVGDLGAHLRLPGFHDRLLALGRRVLVVVLLALAREVARVLNPHVAFERAVLGELE